MVVNEPKEMRAALKELRTRPALIDGGSSQFNHEQLAESSMMAAAAVEGPARYGQHALEDSRTFGEFRTGEPDRADGDQDR